MTNTQISHIVMRRIHRIHTLRAIVNSTVAAGALVVASLYFIGREVWVARVLQNMPRLEDVAAVARFFTYAFMHTNIIVQGLVFCAVAASLWLLSELSKTISLYSPRYA